MTKTPKILTIAMLAVALLAACNPFKITDPADPRFDPAKFSFDDYPTEEELEDAFRKLFPVGTDAAYVDKVLIDAGGARRGVNNYPHMRSYLNTKFKHHNNTFVFDENDKLLNIHVHGGRKLYDDQPGFDDLTQPPGKEN